MSNSTADVCDSSVGKRKLVVTWGQSVHLGCFVKMPEVLANQEVRWYHYSKEKGRYQIAYKYGAGGDKFIETSEKGLVIVGVNEQDAGRYDCWLGGALLCSYNITVDAHRCSAPAKSNDYQKIYSDWCHEFEKYKSAMKSWERKQAVSLPQRFALALSSDNNIVVTKRVISDMFFSSRNTSRVGEGKKYIYFHTTASEINVLSHHACTMIFISQRPSCVYIYICIESS